MQVHAESKLTTVTIVLGLIMFAFLTVAAIAANG